MELLMACINPVTLSIVNRLGVRQNIEVPCNHCLNCGLKKQSQIEFLAKKELLEVYKQNKSASFVTLTYDDYHLPINDLGFVTLQRKHLQNFIKNMRRQIDYYNLDLPFKYLYCGEYGDGSHSTSKTGVSTNRPHYHIVFLGLGPAEVKKFTRKLWKYGLCDIGPLSNGGLKYLCKYLLKARPTKEVKQLREVCHVQNPFFYHSVGLGKKWIIKNMYNIVESGFTFNINGKINLFPTYIMRFVSAHTGVDYIPYVKQFLAREKLPQAKGKGITFLELTNEESFIKYQYMIASLRSKNKPVDDISLNKAYVRPRSYRDRTINSPLVLEALNSVS